ncbi:MAG: OmpA family protein, partial [Pseudomonadales bacterium]|nr:OmpA family protein [Pseudomonadales bacterium]
MNKFYAALLCALLAGCATQQGTDVQKDRNNTAIAAVVGAVAGAVIGGQLDDDGNRDRGVITGAVVGAAAGAGIGAHMDRQEEAFRDALAAEQRRSEVEIQRVRDDLLKLTFDNEVTFDINQSAVKPSFFDSLGKVSEVLEKYDSRARVIGHTDSSGSESYNQSLSERRALAVKDYPVRSGVADYRLTAEGRGELEPRESNATASGRALNRRVELLVT